MTTIIPDTIQKSRWKLVLEYNGADFQGWQRQPDARTVQGELEKGLSLFCGTEIPVHGQGRTDSGVHAEMQVAHTDLPPSVTGEKLLSAMRGILPQDMAVVDAVRVPKEFHARFDALSRTYRYQIVERYHPLLNQTHWLVNSRLDVEQLLTCAAMIPGKNDFRNFSKTGDEYSGTVCEIVRSEWNREGERLIYHIEGNRFLRHLVRRLTGTMVLVATGKMSSDDFSELLNAAEVKQKGFSAPSKGLILENVAYRDND